MAAVPVTIVGMVTHENGASENVTLVGVASITGLGVGGGPINPPGIWGPTDPRPGWGLPEQPPGIWGPTDPRPSHPIVIPKPPTDPPPTPEEPKPPPADGGWGWHPEYGWGYFPMAGGKPNPA